MAAFENAAFDAHERVVFCHDAGSGLHAIIAIHSTALGPAAGGCRLWRYANDDDALTDVLRLSQGMSYKNAMAGLEFGGGKAVIMKSDSFDGSPALFEKFGDCVEELQGRYVTAEDVGMSVAIMEMIARRTKYVSGLPLKAGRAGGDPSPKTAFGIFRGIEAAVRHRRNGADVAVLTVAVQGVGNVGYHLCRYLHEAGASLVVADIDADKVARVVQEFSARTVSFERILDQQADVIAPCALGAVFNEQNIPQIGAEIIAGGANNQLTTDEDGLRLKKAGILYAPDYVINAGGIINVACEYYGNASDADVDEMVEAIGPRLTQIFEESERTGEPTNAIADRQARRIIAEGRS